MPIYLFKCSACGQQDDVLLSIDKIADTKPKCPKCGCGMRRVYTSFAIHGFEYPNSVNYQDTEEDYGEVEQKKEIALTMKKLEQDGKLGELSKEDQEYYEDYCKT